MPLIVILLLVIAGGVATAVLLTGGEGGEQVPPDDPLTTPDGTVLAYYHALRQGDCATVDGFQTAALRAQVAATQEISCAQFAAVADEDPRRLDEILPQVAIEVRYQDESVAVVNTTFDFSGDRPDRADEAYLFRQPDATWMLATRSEVESLAPDNPNLGADLIVFVDPGADESQRAAIETLLAGC